MSSKGATERFVEQSRAHCAFNECHCCAVRYAGRRLVCWNCRRCMCQDCYERPLCVACVAFGQVWNEDESDENRANEEWLREQPTCCRARAEQPQPAAAMHVDSSGGADCPLVHALLQLRYTPATQVNERSVM